MAPRQPASWPVLSACTPPSHPSNPPPHHPCSGGGSQGSLGRARSSSVGRDEHGKFTAGPRPRGRGSGRGGRGEGGGGIFKQAAVEVLRLEKRLMSTGGFGGPGASREPLRVLTYARCNQAVRAYLPRPISQRFYNAYGSLRQTQQPTPCPFRRLQARLRVWRSSAAL